MHHYQSELRDILFNLFEFHDLGRHTLGQPPFALMSEESAREALESLDRLCREELASSYVETDRNPPVFDNGEVILPEGLKASMASYYAGEWHRLELPEHLGGFGAPPSLTTAAFELLAGANCSLVYYLFGSVVAQVIDELATAEQKARYLPQMVDRHWGAAMVLTEPDAGSDVGEARSSARHLHDDVWAITGTKRFITNGEYDAAENIVHLVLARPEGAESGTKGLSMFIVPKVWVEEDGSLGARNGYFCASIEKKMGLKGSVTCEMVYGDDEAVPCRGLLVGNVHEGIRQMFRVIEQARMGVGIKSMANLSAAYQQALQYARERVQGPDLTKIMDKTSPRVRIIEHPDVRRMLMSIKAHVHGMRALTIFTSTIQDEVTRLGGIRAKEARSAHRLNDLLLPLVKGYCSDRSYGLLADALQCFGGSGYCQDHPVEQYIRDQKIDSLYEGTTHIQSLDLLLRKVARDGGQTLGGLFGRIRATLETSEGGEALEAERAQLAAALEHVEAAFTSLLQKATESLYHVGINGNAMLMALAELTIGWLLVRQAAVAHERLGTARGDDRHFYQGKIAAVQWFCHNVLPRLEMTRRQVERSALDLMDVPEEAF